MFKKFFLLAAVLFVISAAFMQGVSAENTVESEYSEYIPPEGEMPPATASFEEEEEINGWIEIDPVSDQTWGSKISVSGVTNLGSDCTVYLTVTRASEVNEMIREEIQVSGNLEENKWSFENLDLSWCDPDYYTITAMVMRQGETLAESKTGFEIKKTFIEMESVGDISAGETLNIKGKALIPDGEQLSVRFFKTPYEGEGSSSALDEKLVSPSESGEWSASFDTYGYEETGYLVLTKIKGGDDFPKAEAYFKIWEPVDTLSGINDCVTGDIVTVRGTAASVVSGDINIYLIPFSEIPKEYLSSEEGPKNPDYEAYCASKKTICLSKDDKGSFSAEFNTGGFSSGEYLVIVDLPSEGCMTETFRLFGQQNNEVFASEGSAENEALEAEIEALRKKLEEKEQVIAEKEAVIEEQKGIIESLMGLLSGFFG